MDRDFEYSRAAKRAQLRDTCAAIVLVVTALIVANVIDKEKYFPRLQGKGYLTSVEQGIKPIPALQPATNDNIVRFYFTPK